MTLTLTQFFFGFIMPNKCSWSKTFKKLYFIGPPLTHSMFIFYNGYEVKGKCLVNIMFPCKMILFRESMINIERDGNYVCYPSINSLEIYGTSYNLITTSLWRFFVTLLMYGEVPKDLFIKLVTNAIEKI